MNFNNFIYIFHQESHTGSKLPEINLLSLNWLNALYSLNQSPTITLNREGSLLKNDYLVDIVNF